ncbi:MAG: polysaccharide export protein [Methylacidiphilales bacterium]|nr:polysaccharide export protein [Candidatus Methylacidiphilales bacterium]
MAYLNASRALRLLGAFLFLALGCLSLTGTAHAQDQNQNQSQANSVGSEGDIQLHCNDLIRITVFQEDDLITETRISKTGYITFPLLGSLHLAGKTVDQATEDIRAALDKDYIIHPQVTLTILEYAKQWVTVLGEVQKPGTVEIPPEGGLDLLGAIALAGGYTRIANPGRVTVRRQVDGKDTVINVNAKDLARDTQVKAFYVQPGDTITVAQSMF